MGRRFTLDPEPWPSSISGSNFLVKCFFLSWRYTPNCPSRRLSIIVDRKGHFYLPDPSQLTHNNGPLGIFRRLHNYSVVGTSKSGCLWLVTERCRKVVLKVLLLTVSSRISVSSVFFWSGENFLLIVRPINGRDSYKPIFLERKYFCWFTNRCRRNKGLLTSLSRKTWRNIVSVKFESKRLWWTSKQKEEILSLVSTQNNYFLRLPN